jgi:hypothetical protein
MNIFILLFNVDKIVYNKLNYKAIRQRSASTNVSIKIANLKDWYADIVYKQNI